MKYWDADNPTETEGDITFRFYGWDYLECETGEIEWPHGGGSSCWGVKIYKMRILIELI
mgnify:FL=1